MSPTQVVRKKVGVTMVKNEEGVLVPTKVVTGWHMCIDYRKRNSATRKYHFPLPFIDQILEWVAGHPFYCFLDGYLGYYQIEIALEDKPPLLVLLILLLFVECPLVCVMH